MMRWTACAIFLLLLNGCADEPFVPTPPALRFVQDSVIISIGQQFRPEYDVDGRVGTLVWTVSDTTVATISADGVVHGIWLGGAYAKATSSLHPQVRDSVLVRVSGVFNVR